MVKRYPGGLISGTAPASSEAGTSGMYRLVEEAQIDAAGKWQKTHSISWADGLSTVTASLIDSSSIIGIYTAYDSLGGTITYSFDTSLAVPAQVSINSATGQLSWTYSNITTALSATFRIKASSPNDIKLKTITLNVAVSPPFSFTFNNAGQTGNTGPTLATLLANTTYSTTTWASDSTKFNMTSQGIQLWTVPKTKNYSIDCVGAMGGSTNGTVYFGGSGARMKGTFALTAGTILKILVGQIGGSGSNQCGGGGGSFVTLADNTILVIAGGGGGAGTSNGTSAGSNLGQPGQITTSGGTGSNSYAGGSGGSAGSTAGAGSGYGCAGAGYSGDSNTSGSAYDGAVAAKSFINGGNGQSGSYYTTTNCVAQSGGFGGGGSGGCNGGGGGGGYSGGGPGGGGGGSYLAAGASSTVSTVGFNGVSGTYQGQGYVTIIEQ